MTNSPLLQHINENIAAIEPSSIESINESASSILNALSTKITATDVSALLSKYSNKLSDSVLTMIDNANRSELISYIQTNSKKPGVVLHSSKQSPIEALQYIAITLAVSLATVFAVKTILHTLAHSELVDRFFDMIL